MKNQNQSQTEGSVAVKGIETAIASIKTARAGMMFLTALTPKERQSLRRVTAGQLALMDSAVQGAQENPALVPASIEVSKFASDVQAAHRLQTLLHDLRDLCSDVQDTLSVVGKEADNATQQVRAIVKSVARTKPTPGLKLLSQRLNPRSGRAGAGKETPETAAAASATAPAAVPVSPPAPDATSPPATKAA